MDFPPPMAAEEPPALSPPVEHATGTKSRSLESEQDARTVAVLDDEPLLRELLAEMLADEGYR